MVDSAGVADAADEGDDHLEEIEGVDDLVTSSLKSHEISANGEKIIRQPLVREGWVSEDRVGLDELLHQTKELRAPAPEHKQEDTHETEHGHASPVSQSEDSIEGNDRHFYILDGFCC